MEATSFVLASLLVLQGGPPDNHPQAKIPSVALTHLGTIKLDTSVPRPPPIRDILDFDIDDQGRIGFYRMEGGLDATLVLVDPSGDVCLEVPLNLGKRELVLPRVRWLAADRWIVFARETKFRGTTKIWFVDTHSGSVRHPDQLNCPATEALAPDHRGGFVIYTTVSNPSDFGPAFFEYGEVIAFDSSGRERWRVSGEAEEGIHRLPFSASITVTTKGKIVLFNQNDKNLAVFDERGRFLGIMESGAMRHCVPDSTEVFPDIGGGIVVNDPYGTPTIWRVPINNPEQVESTDSVEGSRLRLFGRKRAQGYARVELNPRYASGRSFAPLGGVRAAPGGHLWACDGDSFLRLNDEGVVDVIWGEEASDKILREIGGSFVDLRGRTYLLNKRTGAVHVFDHTGKRLHVCQPDPQDFDSRAFCRMAVAGDGSVYTWDGHTRYLRFSPDGERLGFNNLGLTWVNGWLIFQPQDREFWVTHDKEFHLASADGERLLTIRQRPDDEMLRWLGGKVVAPDGSIAVIDDSQLLLPESERTAGRYTVNLYSKTGEPIRTLAVPAGIWPSTPAFNGKYIVIRDVREKSLILLDAETGDPRKLASGSDSQRLIGRPFFSMGGRELWLLQVQARVIERFGLPSYKGTALNGQAYGRGFVPSHGGICPPVILAELLHSRHRSNRGIGYCVTGEAMPGPRLDFHTPDVSRR